MKKIEDFERRLWLLVGATSGYASSLTILLKIPTSGKRKYLPLLRKMSIELTKLMSCIDKIHVELNDLINEIHLQDSEK